jgi:8-oxo-dGTP pyrophosphatase MutT (NUDIX family)
MRPPAIDPQWLAALRASAEQPPRRARVPLLLGAHRIGSVEPDFFAPIAGPAASLVPELLQFEDADAGPMWRILGEGTAALQRIAQSLRAAGAGNVVQQWRDEQLAVWSAQEEQLATVERGVVRPLGIATRAVHLVGRTRDGRFWVQQRAQDKPNDPGLWDTLMGGMVSAADTTQTALARETWEEAGLRLELLQGVVRGGRVALTKPSDSNSAGYVVEQIDWFSATVPDGVQPTNQDGEVAQFLLLDAHELLGKLRRNEFTTEAALILVAAMRAG